MNVVNNIYVKHKYGEFILIAKFEFSVNSNEVRIFKYVDEIDETINKYYCKLNQFNYLDIVMEHARFNNEFYFLPLIITNNDYIQVDENSLLTVPASKLQKVLK